MLRLLGVSGRPIAASALAILTALLGPPTVAANPLTPASPQARLMSDLFWITLGVAGIVLVAVEFLIVYTALRFRMRPGLAMQEPPQIHGNTRLEVMWSVLPAVLLIALGIISVRSMTRLGEIPRDARTVQVTGRQFFWEFSYPQENVRTTNDLRVPVGQPVILEVTSQDVIHSFWVPDLGGKIDANPGLTNRTTFTAERAGVYRGVCAELCGIGHANMLFSVTAMEPGEFQAWLESGGQAAAAQAAQLAAGPSPDLGKQLVVQKGCGNCHAISGVPGMAGAIGPPLTNVGTVAATRKPGTSAEAYLEESIVNPTAFLVSGFPPVMPPNGGTDLSDEERASIVAYLLTLR
jgi:cytochrome c oxidase subunit 2